MSEINMWEIENQHFANGIVTICGVDEAGKARFEAVLLFADLS